RRAASESAGVSSSSTAASTTRSSSSSTGGVVPFPTTWGCRPRRFGSVEPPFDWPVSIVATLSISLKVITASRVLEDPAGNSFPLSRPSGSALSGLDDQQCPSVAAARHDVGGLSVNRRRASYVPQIMRRSRQTSGPRELFNVISMFRKAARRPGSAHGPTATMSASYFDWLRVRSKIASTLSFMLTSQVLSRGTPKSCGLTHPSPRAQRAPPGLRRTRPANVAGRSTPLIDSIPWMVRNTSLFSAREGNAVDLVDAVPDFRVVLGVQSLPDLLVSPGPSGAERGGLDRQGALDGLTQILDV